MSDLITLFRKDINRLIENLKKNKVINNFDDKNINIDHSSKNKQGDLSTNILLILLKKNLVKNFKMKEYIINFFNNLEYIENIDIPKAGFINIFIKKSFLILKLKDLIDNTTIKERQKLNRKKINIEFVSANPTGPIHVAHMRGAVLGDVLASILESVGHEVTREYYVNDAGSQIAILGTSLFKRYQQLLGLNIEIENSEYPGKYLIDIAKNLINEDGNKWLTFKDHKEREIFFKNYAVNFLLNEIKKDLSLINVNFDKFTYESQIVEDKFIDKVFSLLKKKNLIYEGILEKPLGDDSNEKWEPRNQLLYRSSKFLDNVDRPFQKENGDWTYFANDSAYHYQKYIRGFDKLINIWGADHIGYIPRMKSIVDVFSNKNNYLDVYICQIVRLIKNNSLLKMSKRDGNFITLKEIYNQVGKDALRYYMISTKNETPMDFDINKVIEKNKDNPVFYCQYAYARASSVIRKSKELKNFTKIEDSFSILSPSSLSQYEWKIILKILFWPYILIQTSETKQPHRITNYLEDLCSDFHSFWNKGQSNKSLRMIDENDLNKTISRLIWIESFRIVLKQAFKIIDIDAPENM